MLTKIGKNAVKLWIVNKTAEPDYPQLLLYLRTNRHPRKKTPIPDPGYWGLIGGAVDGKENPLEAILRELNEEWKSSLPLFNFDYVGRIEPDPQDPTFDPHDFFRAEIKTTYNESLGLTEGRGLVYFEPNEILTPDFKIPNYFKSFLKENKDKILNSFKSPNVLFTNNNKILKITYNRNDEEIFTF